MKAEKIIRTWTTQKFNNPAGPEMEKEKDRESILNVWKELRTGSKIPYLFPQNRQFLQ